jgi:prefoldin subunit 5
MQLSDCENTNGFWEDADGRQLDCQLRMLERLVEGLQAEVHALRLERSRIMAGSQAT